MCVHVPRAVCERAHDALSASALVYLASALAYLASARARVTFCAWSLSVRDALKK